MNRIETPRNFHFHQTPEGIDAWSHANRGVPISKEDARNDKSKITDALYAFFDHELT
jgi:hypothetical protein